MDIRVNSERSISIKQEIPISINGNIFERIIFTITYKDKEEYGRYILRNRSYDKISNLVSGRISIKRQYIRFSYELISIEGKRVYMVTEIKVIETPENIKRIRKNKIKKIKVALS